jgi:hypothetical protein
MMIKLINFKDKKRQVFYKYNIYYLFSIIIIRVLSIYNILFAVDFNKYFNFCEQLVIICNF